jgi:hypothetical protein
MKPFAAVDFESTFFPKRKIGLKTMGVDQYLFHEETDIYLASVHTAEGSAVCHPAEFEWEQISHLDWVSHNAGFDRRVWRRLCAVRPELKKLTPKNWHCTANMSCWYGNPRDLKGAVLAFFNEDISKDARKKMENKTYLELRNGPDWPAILEYADRDAYWCYRLWEEGADGWPEQEHRISELTMQQVMRGLPVDEEYLESSIKRLDRACWEAKKHLPWANGTSEEAAVLSPIALAEECRKIGIKPPISMAEDDVACQLWEEENSHIYWVKFMRRYRKANLLKTKLTAMKNRISPVHGRIDFSQKYCGAHTKRASGDQGFNVQGFQRDALACVDLLPGQSVKDLPNKDKVDMRRVIRANEGQLIVADLAQIEPRTLAWVVNDREKIKLINQGMSVYQVHAVQTLGWTGGTLKKEDPDKYALCKMRVLGLSYGCGHAKFVNYCWTQFGHMITPRESKKQVNDFRQKEKLIVKFWNKLENQLADAVGGDFAIDLPSWNSVNYRNVTKEMGKFHKMETTAILATGRKNRLWGSLICENVIQSISRDAFYEKLLAIEDGGLNTLFAVHDEGIVDEVSAKESKEALQFVYEMMRAPCEWMPGIALDTEAFLTPYYKK